MVFKDSGLIRKLTISETDMTATSTAMREATNQYRQCGVRRSCWIMELVLSVESNCWLMKRSVCVGAVSSGKESGATSGLDMGLRP